MDAIIRETKSIKLQVIGHVLIIYRQSDDKKIELPRK
jgi:RNA-binding protein